MSDTGGSSMQTAILVTSSLACFVVFVDVMVRWLGNKPVKKKEKHVEIIPIETKIVCEKDSQTNAVEEEPYVHVKQLSSQHQQQQQQLLLQPHEPEIVEEDLKRDIAVTSSGHKLDDNIDARHPDKYVLRGRTRRASKAASSTGSSAHGVGDIFSVSGLPPEVINARLFGQGCESVAVRNAVSDSYDALRSTVDLSYKTENLPRSVYTKLDKIGEIEDHCANLTAELDKCSVALVHAVNEDEKPESDQSLGGANGNPVNSFQNKRNALRTRWGGMRREYYCVEVHLKNASGYQQFYFECEDVRKYLVDLIRTSRDMMHTEDTALDGDTLLQEAQRVSDQLAFWEGISRDLIDRSCHIVPVRMRTEPLTSSVAATSLCTYQNGKLSVTEGDQLMIIDNSDPNTWCVRTAADVEGSLPALVCLIPPPDNDAIRAANRIAQYMQLAYSNVIRLWKKRLILYCIAVLNKMLSEKGELFRAVGPDSRQEIEDSQGRLHEAYDELFPEDPRYGDLTVLHRDLNNAVTKAPAHAQQSDALQTHCVDELHDLERLLGILRKLIQRANDFKMLCNTRLDPSMGLDDSELEMLEQEEEEEEGLAISVQHQTTTIGETTSFESSTGEVKETFSIRGIIDTRDDSEISMQDAIDRGIIDADRGLYINPLTREEIPIPGAMTAGLIVVESSETKRKKEQTQAVGVVTVTITRETRPYTILRVRDPRTEKELAVNDAVDAGIFDPKKGQWHNSESGETLSVTDAIDSGVLIVEYDDEVEKTDPEEMTRTFAVFGVLDRKADRRLPFYEACQRGLIDKDDGIFLDTLTGDKMHVVDAARQGWVKVRVVDDPTKIDQFLSRTRTDSTESGGSDEIGN